MIGSNSNQFSLLFTCPSVFHLIIGISALSNFNPTSTSKGLISLPKVMLLLTQLTYTRLQWGSSGCQKWKTSSELHPSISDSSCNSNICSISIKSVSQITKTRYTSICLSFHHQVLIQSSFMDCPITSPTPETVSYPRQVTMHTTSPLVNQFFYILCNEGHFPEFTIIFPPLIPTINLVFPAFTFNHLSRMLALQSVTCLLSCSIVGAISNNSSTYNK